MDKEASQQIRTLVRHSVQKAKPLSEIIQLCQEQLKDVSTQTTKYIEEKFIKYCCQNACDDIRLKLYAGSMLLQDLKELVSDLSDTSKLCGNPSKFLSFSQYSQLMLSAAETFNEEQKEHISSVLRSMVLDEIKEASNNILNSTYVLNSSEFIKRFHQFLKDYKTQFYTNLSLSVLTKDDFVWSTEQNWEQFELFFSQDAQNLTERNLQFLSELREQVANFGSITSEQKKNLQETIEKIRSAPNIQSYIEKNRDVLRVEQAVLVLSKILPVIENLENFEDIERVEFQAEYIFYVDASLEKHIWHGKNIQLVASVVECVGQTLHWDVSGKDGKPVTQNKANASNVPGQDGCNGDHGKPGESGGNIQIVAETYLNIDNLSIYTDGGNGSDGQEGGNGGPGMDGKNGSFMKEDEFANIFVSPVRIVGNREDAIKNAVTYFKTHSKDQLEPSLKNMDDNGEKVGDKAFPERHIYISNTFNNGISYEYCFSQSKYERHFYVLIKGQDGGKAIPGGKGGLGGMGGQGGYPGDVALYKFDNTLFINHSITISASSGKNGDQGKKGENGEDGANGIPGPDIGMVHKTPWRSPVRFKNGKFTLVTRPNGRGNSVWCSKFKQYREIVAQVSDNSDMHCQAQTDSNSVSTQLITSVKKSALHVDKTLRKFETLEKFVARKADREKESWKETIRNLNAKENRFQLNNRKNVIDGHRKIYFSAGNDKLQDIRWDEIMKVTSNDSDSDFLNVFSQYSIDNLDTWKFVKKQIPTKSGPDSLFHALFGEKFFGTLVDASCLKRRKDIVNQIRNLCQNSIPEHVHKELLMSLQNLLLTDRNEHLNQDQLESMMKLSKKSFSVTADQDYLMMEVLMGNDVQGVSKELLAAANWFFDLLDTENLPLNQYEATFIAACLNIDLSINLDASEVGVHKFEENRKFLALDERGNFIRESFCLVRDWSPVEDYMHSIFSNKNKTKAESLFVLPEKVKDIMLSRCQTNNSHALVLVQIVFAKQFLSKEDQIHKPSSSYQLRSQASVTLLLTEVLSLLWADKYYAPLFYIALKYPITAWCREICLLYLEVSMTDNFTSMEAKELAYTHYRTILSKFPSNMLYHLANLIKLNEANYRNEFLGTNDHVLKNELMELEKFGPFNSNHEYKELNGLATMSQWHHQLNKQHCLKRLKTCLVGIYQQLSEPEMSKLFYYYYSLVDKTGNLDDFLSECNQPKFCDGNAFEHVCDILKTFHSGRWSLDKDAINLLLISSSLEDFKSKMNNRVPSKIERNISQIKTIVLADPQTDVEKEKLDLIFDTLQSQKFDSAISFAKFEITAEALVSWARNFKEKVKTTDQASLTDIESMIREALQRVDQAFHHFFNLTLFATQKLAIFGSALYIVEPLLKAKNINRSNPKNLLLQVSTGDGKSYIVAAVAIIRGLFGQRTDIITSASLLAKRDCYKFRKMYECFDLSVGTISMDDPKQRALEYKNTVVYGEASLFQRDYLVDHFYGQNVRGNREFDALIIDEVDSMFLDKGNNVLYLSQYPASLEILERIYLVIWQSTLSMLGRNHYDALDIHDSILATLSPVLQKKDLAKFCNPDVLWNDLKAAKVISSTGVIINSTPATLINLNLETPQYLGLLAVLKNTCEQNFASQHVPKNMHDFVKLHLLDWIKSAYLATQMEEGVQYVLHAQRFHGDKHEKILMIDLDTGTDLSDSHWGDGLHQFLQLKHGCKLSPASLKSVFISNISYFKLYKNMLGLTGTLGSKAEKHFLKQTYDVNFLVIPTALANNFFEEEPIVCHSAEKWLSTIEGDISEKLDKNRSVLVICESIKQVNTVADYVANRKRGISRTIIYSRDSDSCDVVASKQSLQPETLIFSTNLAGRGTDIQITPTLAEAGGLHVILAYLPSNTRIRWQGMGRAGRCGNPGSGRMIFQGRSHNGNLSAIDYINQTEQEEQNKITEIYSHYNHVVCCEEEKFAEFRKKFDSLRRDLEVSTSDWHNSSQTTNGPSIQNETKQVILQNILNDWTFWLDGYSSYLRHVKPRQQLSHSEHLYCQAAHKKLMKEYEDKFVSYQDIRSKLNEIGLYGRPTESIKPITTPILDDALAIKLAARHIKSRNIKTGKGIFGNVVAKNCNTNSDLVTIANYYLIQSQLMENGLKAENVVRDAVKVLEGFRKHQMSQMEMPRSLAGNEILGSPTTKLKDGFLIQKTARCGLMQLYVETITKLIGKSNVEPSDFVDLVDGESSKAAILYRKLFQGNVLQYPSFKELFESDKLKFLELQKLAKKMNTEVDDFVPLPNHRTKEPSIVNKQYSEYLRNKKSFQRRLHTATFKGFLQEIQSAIQRKAKFLVIPKTTPTNSTNEMLRWLKPQENRENSNIFIFSKAISPVSFEGQVLYADQNSLEQAMAIEKQEAFHVTVASVDFEKLKRIQLQTYSKLIFSDFTAIPCIDIITSGAIFDELGSANALLDGYLNSENILESLKSRNDYEKNSVFSYMGETVQQKVIDLIYSKCIYQLVKLKMIKCKSLGQNHFHTNLFQTSICDRILCESYNQHILRGITVNPENIQADKAQSFALSLLQSIYSTYDCKKTLGTEAISEIFPSLPESLLEEVRSLLEIWEIIDNSNVLLVDLTNFPDFPASAEKNQQCSPLKIDTLQYIYNCVKGHLEIAEKLKDKQFQKGLEQRLKELAGYIHLGTDCTYVSKDLDLRKLVPSEHIIDYLQEQSRLKNLGLDKTFDCQTDYTTRMIINTAGIFLLGLGQVVAGSTLSLSVMGVGMGSVVVASGLHDLAFGVQSIWSGTFDRQDWLKSKTIDTVICAGLLGAGYMAKTVLMGANIGIPSTYLLESKFDNTSFTKLVEFGGPKLVEYIQKGKICALAIKYSGTYIDTVLSKLWNRIVINVKLQIHNNNKLRSAISHMIRNHGDDEAKKQVASNSKQLEHILVNSKSIPLSTYRFIKPHVLKGLSNLIETFTGYAKKYLPLDRTKVTASVAASTLASAEQMLALQAMLQSINEYLSKLVEHIFPESNEQNENLYDVSADKIKELQDIVAETVIGIIKSTHFNKVKVQLNTKVSSAIEDVNRKAYDKMQSYLKTFAAEEKLNSESSSIRNEANLTAAEEEVHKREVENFEEQNKK